MSVTSLSPELIKERKELMKYIYAFLLILLATVKAQSQGFNIPTNACPVTPVTFTSPQPSATTHRWDFCTGDLMETPTASLVTDFINDESTIQDDAHAPQAMEVVFDGQEYFGFITNVSNSNLIRADFGNSLENLPVYRSMNIGITNCFEMAFIKEGTNWYAIVARNINNPIRLNFGNSLKNVPSVTQILDPLGNYPNPYLFGGSQFTVKLMRDGSDIIGLFLNTLTINSPFIDDTRMILVNFGNSVTNPVTLSNLIVTPNLGRFIAPTSSNPGFDIIKDKNTWYGITVGRGNIRILNFGTNLYSIPTATEITSNISGFDVNQENTRVRLVKDGPNYFAFFISLDGDVKRLNFGASMNNASPVLTNFGNFNLIGTKQLVNRPSFALAYAKKDSKPYLFTINRHPNNFPPTNQNQLVRIDFPDNCNSSVGASHLTNPTVSFLKPGKFYIELIASDQNLINTYYLDSISITNATIGNFTFTNQCSDEQTVFNNLSFGDDANVQSWLWDFGDGNSSSLKNPVHKYALPGSYMVKLTVNNFTGCNNTIEKTVRISGRPKADFIVKSIDCVTGMVEFEDISSQTALDIANGVRIQQRYWTFGDGRQLFATPAETRTIIRKGDPAFYTFIPAYQPGNYTVTLTVTDDAGCASSVSKIISVRSNEAPLVNFSNTLACQGAPVRFTDLSVLPSGVSGEITGWSWDFGGTGTSNLKNPVHIFPNPGMYNVRLTASKAQGCGSSITLPVEVKASIQSLFISNVETGNAPLSVTFTNQSVGAVAFDWDFGNGIKSAQESPTVTYTQKGIYQVTLQAKNSLGCGTIATKTINVIENPTAIEPSSSFNVGVYPNPTQEILNIDVSSLQGISSEIVLFDLTGKLLLQYRTLPEERIVRFDLHSFQNGMYILKIKTPNRLFVEKILKQ